MRKVIIFDFDGTLANTLPDLKITINLTRAFYQLSPVTEDDVLLHVNNHIPAYIRLMIPELGSEALWDEAEQKYYQLYDEHYLSETVPYPGIVSMLEKLKADGAKLAVMSNKNHSHILKMVSALFPNLFDSIWGTIPEVPAKPNPARAFMIAKEFDADISDVAFVGDSDVDMITACNAGAIPIGVAWGYRPADVLRENGAKYTPENADELYEILKKYDKHSYALSEDEIAQITELCGETSATTLGDLKMLIKRTEAELRLAKDAFKPDMLEQVIIDEIEKGFDEIGAQIREDLKEEMENARTHFETQKQHRHEQNELHEEPHNK